MRDRRKRATIIAVLALCMSMLLGGGTATADSPRAGRTIVGGDHWITPGSPVAQPVRVSSADSWQKGRLLRTVEADRAKDTVYTTIDFFDMQYYWGLAWYNNKYDVKSVVQVDLVYDGVVQQSAAVTARASGKRLAVTVPLSLASVPDQGSYTVRLSARLSGMYWDSYRSCDLSTSASYTIIKNNILG